MKFNTTIFGLLDVDPETIIVFPNAFAGFEHCTRFKLLHEEGKPVVQWLQSLDDPDVNFSVVEPAVFNIFYEFALSREELDLLHSPQPEDILILVMLIKTEADQLANDSGPGQWGKRNITGNFTKPLVINAKSRVGYQKILDKSRLEQVTTLREV